MKKYVHSKQIHSREQEVVLEKLADSVARDGCKFLEIGTWCGDSAIILGRVAKSHRGRVFCVDWWKGSTGTPLDLVAQSEDIYSVFWRRIIEADLQDVVVPIRGSSEVVGSILKPDVFDFVFIDADHRYSALKRDIDLYRPCVRIDGGILAGHDCEGYLHEYSSSFLEEGRERDLHQSVHCGVILAVSEVFDSFSISHNIWSVKSTKDNNWKPTDCNLTDIEDKPRTGMAPFAFSDKYCLFRYFDDIYAVPLQLKTVDLTCGQERNREEILRYPNIEAAEKDLKQIFYDLPKALYYYNDFNICEYKGRVHAILSCYDISILPHLTEEMLSIGREQSVYINAETEEDVKESIDSLCEIIYSDKKISIVEYNKFYYVFPSHLGPGVISYHLRQSVPGAYLWKREKLEDLWRTLAEFGFDNGGNSPQQISSAFGVVNLAGDDRFKTLAALKIKPNVTVSQELETCLATEIEKKSERISELEASIERVSKEKTNRILELQDDLERERQLASNRIRELEQALSLLQDTPSKASDD